MPIPDFQSAMLPILRHISDGEEHASSEYLSALAEEFELTPGERQQLIPSGSQPLYVNRIAWAVTHMSKAGLIERTGRGRIRITSRGRAVLSQELTRIDASYLFQFPEYKQFRRGTSSDGNASPVIVGDDVRGHGLEPTPHELLDSSYQLLRKTLAHDLLDRIRRSTPEFFERLVIDLLVAMGYGGSQRDAAQAVGRSGDDGIDGIIKEDKLGLDFVYVQAKRWNNPVSRPTVQGFAGSLEGQRARKGILMTTSTFTRDAVEYVNRIEKRIVLVDGEQLASLMIEHDVGVSEVTTYQIKRLDADYFEET